MQNQQTMSRALIQMTAVDRTRQAILLERLATSANQQREKLSTRMNIIKFGRIYCLDNRGFG